MARTVDSRWFETYRNAKNAFEQQGQSATLASVAQALGMNQKTLNRMVAAGRYLERCLPAIEQPQVRCSYVHIELLDKISRISAPLADELLPPALVNQISIAELSQRLDALRSQSPFLAHAINARADKRRTAKGLVRDLFSFLTHTPLEFFEAPGGTVLKAATTSLFQAPTAALLDKQGSPQVVLFCKVGGDSRPASGVAMDLYELAMARRHMARRVWMVFPERSDVFLHLAELSLWLGGSPLHEDTGWLRLAYFHDFQERLVLNVFFEDACSELLAEVSAGNRRFEPDQLTWAGAPPGKPGELTALGIGYTPKLPRAGSSRSYTEYLIASADELTPYLTRLKVEADLEL
ncbi:hypothetical protein [Metapseudomonas boanensis]|uniref:Transcriptional regulator n=1 Tax=Metapseudomonas boanensis TaxID=2822138 RepID=A0ABS5XI10_9GAMM|nr:hypothetical protein [Pseudomonas boanensis]MBT8767326.1 hypothetical protein [Pseudomonas boanensis]